jgi:Tetratricopeptide repeat
MHEIVPSGPLPPLGGGRVRERGLRGTKSPPARALAAWNAYLVQYPRGMFAPEARFNRAVCLARVGRYDEAAQALTPFTDHQRPPGYRHLDACALLRWMSERSPSAAGPPAGCDEP